MKTSQWMIKSLMLCAALSLGACGGGSGSGSGNDQSPCKQGEIVENGACKAASLTTPTLTSAIRATDGSVAVSGTGTVGTMIKIDWKNSGTYTTTALTGTSFSYIIPASFGLVAGGGVSSGLSLPFTITENAGVTASRLPHPGYTSSQCYGTGGDMLISCTDTLALDLSGAGKQDGMYANVNARSYTKIGFNKEVLPDSASSWCAVKDNVTGLIWENHTTTPSGYTNYDSTTSAQKYDNATNSFVNPTQAEIDASTNSVGRKNAMNVANLCGYTDGQWRLPTVDELQSIVDYSKPYLEPAINTSYFQNTDGSVYWSSSPYVGDSGSAWVVYFGDGTVGNDYRNAYNGIRVRLVRVGQ